jgi:hypothetical protein
LYLTPSRLSLGMHSLIYTYVCQPHSAFLSSFQNLRIVLGHKLLAQLDVFVLSLLLAGTSIDDLLPLVVLGLAL